jgi:cytochrome c biogenesis protein CcdA
MLEIGLAGAFLGGTLAIFSPCSALLLPAFFAYAFQSRTELVLRTFVFFVGLVTLLVPLGMGAGFASALVIGYRETAILVAGSILILFGVLELTGSGFSLLPRRLSGLARGGKSWSAVYFAGLVYSFAGFCAGPILGSVLTVAAGSGSPVWGGLLLLAYAFGMTVPLFLLASLWDRYRLGERAWLRGRVLRIGPREIHSFNLIAGLLFIGLGLLFLATGGTAALTRFYADIGLERLSQSAQDALFHLLARLPDWVWLALLTCAAGAAWWFRRRRRAGVSG